MAIQKPTFKLYGGDLSSYLAYMVQKKVGIQNTNIDNPINKHRFP